jgi:hypothetical protein
MVNCPHCNFQIVNNEQVCPYCKKPIGSQKPQPKGNPKVCVGIIIIFIVVIILVLVYIYSPTGDDTHSVTIQNKTNVETRLHIQANREPVGYVLLAPEESTILDDEFKNGDEIHIFNPNNSAQDITFTMGDKKLHFTVYLSEIKYN